MTPGDLRTSPPRRDRPARLGPAQSGQPSPLRESPARLGSVQSGQGEARPEQRKPAQRRSPPPSARKRHLEEAENVDTPAAKRSLQTQEVVHERSDNSKHHGREADVRRSLDFDTWESSGLLALQRHYGGDGDDNNQFGDDVQPARAISVDGVPAEPTYDVRPAHTEPHSEGFAHLLFLDQPEEEVEDTAAKINTWRIIPQRALPKVADFIIEIEARATGGAECREHNCEGCDACNRRFFAWQDFRFLFQLLARNKEAEPQAQQTQKSGPKVDDIIRDRAQRVKQYGWKGVVEEYISDAALRLKSDLDKGPATPVRRTLGEPASAQDADAFCRNAKTMQCGAAAYCITGGVVLPDSARLREKLREKIKPEVPEKTSALLEMRASRLAEMRDRVTAEMIHELDESLAKQAAVLKPFKKKGRTGWRNEFIRALHGTRAGPSL